MKNQTMKDLYFEKFGDSSVLQYGEIVRPQVDFDKEVLVKTSYIGLNFADIYRRRGTYHIEPKMPYINGYEGSGTIVEAADETLLGKKILFVDVPFANAEFVAVPLENLIFLPQTIDLKMAATIGLQGLTADFLAHDLARNSAGDKVFITGVSGGVGQILSQMLLADGLEVYGSAAPAKAQLALDFGVKKVFPSREKDWLDDWIGQFDTVFDGVGVTVEQSIQLLKNRGCLIFFGMAGGNPPALDLVDLMAHSKSVMTGDLWDFLTSFQERKIRARRLFDYIEQGKIKISPAQIFKLSDGKLAQDFLESGKSSGKILLTTE